MAESLPKPWTVDDFLAWEGQQEERYEFIDGRILAMVGGTNAHAFIKGNVFGTLRDRLRGQPCRPIVDGPRIVTATATFYPDVIVTCSPLEPGADRVDEPVVVVEVLSPTTADKDRSAKWVGYQDIPSLQHYVLIAQDQRRVELITRLSDGWHLKTLRPPESRVELSAIRTTIVFDEIYEDSGA